MRPSWEANVTTWNLSPLGYEYSRSQLQQLLTKGQAVVMVQEVRFPLGARQRVKNELKHLHPEYYCFLKAGKDPLSSDGDGMHTERQKAHGATEDTSRWPRSSNEKYSGRHRDANGTLRQTRKRSGTWPEGEYCG